METILIADCALSQEEYTGYNMHLYKRAYETKRTKLFMLIGLLVISYCIHLFVYSQGHDEFPLFHSLIIGGFVAIYFWIPYKLRRFLNKQYDALPMLKVLTTYELTDALVTAENELGRNEMVWALFTRAETYGHWVMVHLQNRTFLALDTHRINLPHTIKELLLLLQKHRIPMNPDEIA